MSGTSTQSSQPSSPFAADLELALALADATDSLALERFQASDLEVQLKADRTHVTDADRAIEERIRAILGERAPADRVFGEEFGGDLGSGRVWVIDPIDGTANFMRGVPLWATLISLVVDGEPVVGVCSAPAYGARWWAASGAGAFVSRRGGNPLRIHVSDVSRLDEAQFSFNGLKYWQDAGLESQLLSITQRLWRDRAIGDAISYMYVAEGAFEGAGELGLKPWDIAAIVPIIHEAGGTVTNFAGGSALEGEGTLATNARIAHELLRAIGQVSA